MFTCPNCSQQLVRVQNQSGIFWVCKGWLGDPHSTITTVGASGMISGILAFYALQFPHARLTMFFRFYWVHIPAWGAFLGWGLLQLIGVVNQLSGFSRVSSLAHVGGALSGIVLWLLWRKHA